MAYWSDVFTPKTWEEFKKAGGTVSGFTFRMRATVAKIKPGDQLCCYVAGISRWIGVLEVTGDSYEDLETVIWSGPEFYPERLPVKIVSEAASFETAVPAKDLLDDMPMFDGLSKVTSEWAIRFRRSPGVMSEKDGATVCQAIHVSIQDPVIKPIPKSKLGGAILETEAGVVDEAGKAAPEETPSSGDAESGSPHTEMQWLLLRLAQTMGLSVWAPLADRKKEWNGNVIEALDLLKELPIPFNPAVKKVVENIDVLWLQEHSVVAAFEIEHSTSIYSGLLRMSDLLAMQPNLSIPLYVVAPDQRRAQVMSNVNRPTFNVLKPPLSQICSYLSYSAVREAIDQVQAIAQYVKPEVIDDFAESCVLLEG